jgi:hypothetical protein
VSNEPFPPPETPPPGSPGKSPVNIWLERSGLPGKLMAGAALVGIISLFLPAASMSASAMGVSVSASSGMCLSDWRGILGLLCYLAVLGLGFFLYQANTPEQVLFALLLLIATIGGGSGPFGGVSVSPSIGTILNLLAALAVGAGAGMKAKEDKLF